MLIPKDNEKHLEEVPQVIRRALQIVPVAHMEEVLEEALPGYSPVAVPTVAENAFPAAAEPSVHH